MVATKLLYKNILMQKDMQIPVRIYEISKLPQAFSFSLNIFTISFNFLNASEI